MYQVYIDKPSYFEPDFAGEFKDLQSAEAFAEREKEGDREITYVIKETNGCFNSYGELVSTVVKRG